MNTKNELWKADKELFDSLRGKYRSHEEANFFQNMQFKEEYEPSLSNDLIMAEDDNSLGIYIVRVNYDEYMVGCYQYPAREIYVMNLSEALNVKLMDIGIGDSDETIGQWLHSINYKGVKYNQNFDDE